MIAPNEHFGGRPIDTSNRFEVCRQADKILIHQILVGHPIRLSMDEALNLAAWILALSDGDSSIEHVARIVAAIKKLTP